MGAEIRDAGSNCNHKILRRVKILKTKTISMNEKLVMMLNAFALQHRHIPSGCLKLSGTV
jgi:hypothetical protein